ncbi:MAG TPA: hypothetical protein VKR32_01370, partial [Puia sp.]|nr:hypothetical protein [Puia sp.]
SDSIFCNTYETLYPNEIYGYLWCSRSKRAEDDSLGSQGLAVDAWKRLIDAATRIDSNKYKDMIIQTHFYLVQYYNDDKHDKQAAISELDKVLAIDPTNQDAIKFKRLLTTPARRVPSKK